MEIKHFLFFSKLIRYLTIKKPQLTRLEIEIHIDDVGVDGSLTDMTETLFSRFNNDSIINF